MSFHTLFIKSTIYGFALLVVVMFLLKNNEKWKFRIFGLLAIMLPLAGFSSLEYITLKTRWDTAILGDYTTFNYRDVHKNFNKLKDVMLEGEYPKKGRMHKDGFELYWPIDSPGFHINKYGLRTRDPGEKNIGDYRIAVLGGSTIWSRFVVDKETIPQLLEARFHKAGEQNVEVYNLGLEGMTFPTSLRLLKKFQPLYRFDEAIFYQGVNEFGVHGRRIPDDVNIDTQHQGPPPALFNYANQFLLFKAATALYLDWTHPDVSADNPKMVKWLNGKMEWYSKTYDEAMAYCRQEGLKCEYFIQPTLFNKKKRTSVEDVLYRNFSRSHPYLETSYRAMTKLVLEKYPDTHHDVTDALKDFDRPSYQDWCHATGEAHDVISKAIFAKLAEEGKR